MSHSLRFHFQKQFSVDTQIEATGNFSFEATSPTVALFGPSGCGKTTFLRWIAGLVGGDGGELIWDEESWNKRAPQDRRIGYLAQSYALFPHLSVVDNIGYGLRRFGPPERNARVNELLNLFEIESLRPRKIATLSGGQRQRVAFARALAIRPQLLLLDEPFSALDYATRTRLIPEFVGWLRHFEIPAIVVTHDPYEARMLGSQCFVFEEGKLRPLTSES